MLTMVNRANTRLPVCAVDVLCDLRRLWPKVDTYPFKPFSYKALGSNQAFFPGTDKENRAERTRNKSFPAHRLQ
jgi:hypothetical protein